jgi:hypothetical protein
VVVTRSDQHLLRWVARFFSLQRYLIRLVARGVCSTGPGAIGSRIPVQLYNSKQRRQAKGDLYSGGQA